MGRRTIWVVLAVGLLVMVAGCSGSLSKEDMGAVGLSPCSDPGTGLSFLRPAACQQAGSTFFECSLLSPAQSLVFLGVERITLSDDELLVLFKQRLGWNSLPDPVETYQGTEFSWDRHVFETKLGNLGLSESLNPDAPVRVEWNAARLESGRLVVSLLTEPADYAANQVRYEAIMTHILRGLSLRQ